MPVHAMGLDLGLKRDHSALVIVEQLVRAVVSDRLPERGFEQPADSDPSIIEEDYPVVHCQR
jgi:hypothetical protein